MRTLLWSYLPCSIVGSYFRTTKVDCYRVYCILYTSVRKYLITTGTRCSRVNYYVDEIIRCMSSYKLIIRYENFRTELYSIVEILIRVLRGMFEILLGAGLCTPNETVGILVTGNFSSRSDQYGHLLVPFAPPSLRG